MTIYRLVDHGYPFKKIMKGRAWVGRVAKMGDGSGYLGVIGKDEVTRPTEREAFEEVAARAMGHPSAAVLHAKNARVRKVKRLQAQVERALGDRIFNEVSRGDFTTLDKLGPAGLPLGIQAVTRFIKEGT